MTRHAPCFREPDTDKPVHTRVAASLGFCETVQVAPAQAPRFSWLQEAMKGEQREDTEHGPPNSQLVTATASATLSGTGVRKPLGTLPRRRRRTSRALVPHSPGCRPTARLVSEAPQEDVVRNSTFVLSPPYSSTCDQHVWSGARSDF